MDHSVFNNSDEESRESESDNVIHLHPNRSHKLTVEDEFLLMMMKLRVGLADLDLSVRFGISEGCVSRTFITWLNYIYLTLGSMSTWPHRDIILAHSPPEFLRNFQPP